MKIEKVANLEVKVFVPYQIVINVETASDESELRNAANRLAASIHTPLRTLAVQLRNVVAHV